MTEAELTHQEETVLNGFVHADRFGISGHDFRNLGGSRHTSEGNHPVHYVALGEDADDISVAQDWQSADAVFHHETSGFEYGAVSVDGIDSSVFHDIVNFPHTSLLGSGLWAGSGLPPAAGFNTLSCQRAVEEQP